VGVIISHKYNRRVDRKLLVFSFDGDDVGHLLTTLDLRNYTGYYIKSAKQSELSRFPLAVRNKVKKNQEAILLGKNAGSYVPYVYIYENGNFQVYAGNKISRRY